MYGQKDAHIDKDIPKASRCGAVLMQWIGKLEK